MRTWLFTGGLWWGSGRVTAPFRAGGERWRAFWSKRKDKDKAGSGGRFWNMMTSLTGQSAEKTQNAESEERSDSVAPERGTESPVGTSRSVLSLSSAEFIRGTDDDVLTV